MQKLKLDWNAKTAGARLRNQREENSMRRTLWIAAVALMPLALSAQTGREPLIRQAIDATRLARLVGNTRPEAATARDLGPVAADLLMDHMLLELRRSAAAQQALESFLGRVQDPHSPDYHRWLTAAQFAQAYGAAPADVATVSAWLRTQGLSVNFVYPGGMVVDFSGTAGQVASAFHTAIHQLDVNGERHIANVSDPEIPAALAPAVSGVLSLHDFRPRALRKARPNFTYTTQGQIYQAIVPGDLATIYNLNPLFAAGLAGQGQTIAVIEDADLYSADDFNTFRSTFGLTQYGGTLATVHPGCSDPGIRSGDDSEATLDAEWASAAAPAANIVVASCSSTRSTFGGLLALENLVNGSNPPSILSLSYGECEAANGAALNQAFDTAYEQAAAEGISVFVAAGDEGAAACDAGATGATHGIGVSAWASTPYNVAVGGTDFGDSYAGTNGTYWSSTNNANYASALSYIPEIPWNDSCAGALLASVLGFSAGYGPGGLCLSNMARQDGLLQVVAGSGGPSGCATGNPANPGIVGGSCQGYAKPSWQAGVAGLAADGVRDIPDVSLFAGTGIWGHYYVMCYSNQYNSGAPCDGDPSTWAGAGGTSFAAPIMAGIQALVNQNQGGAQGNPNPAYYALAAAGAGVCDASAGDNAGSSCIFHNVTQGDIAVNCGGAENCYGETASGGFGRRGQVALDGALSVSDTAYNPAYATAPGWNFATGLGSINAANLVYNWPAQQ